jgi:SPP1 gp7 family putative phage head morphogenesis protein
MAKQKSKPITNEIAAASRDVDLFSGYLPIRENPDKVLKTQSGGQGVRIYEDLERDDQVATTLQTRRLAVIGCEWQVDAASDKRADKRVAEFVQQVLEKANFDRVCYDLLQGLLTGYKLSEIIWDVSEGDISIAEFRGREPHRFVFDWADYPRLLTSQNLIEGELLPERKFQSFSYGSSSHNPYGLGLGHKCYWPVWFKKNGIKFWVIFAEKFGSPTAVGKYPVGATEPEQEKLLTAIKSIQQETGIIIPDGMIIELLEAQRAMSGKNTYESLCEYMDRSISKVVLGQTLTTQPGDSGSYALGQVQESVRQDIVKADADLLSERLNKQVVRWICDYNFPPEMLVNGYPTVWRRTEPEQDLKALADRDKLIIVDMGLGKFVPLSYLSETYGIPLAKDVDPDQVIGTGGVISTDAGIQDGRPGGSPLGGGDQNLSFAEGDSGDVIDSTSAAASQKAASFVNTSRISAIIQAGTLTATQAPIQQILPALDIPGLEETLTRSMFFIVGNGYLQAQGETLTPALSQKERGQSFAGAILPRPLEKKRGQSFAGAILPRPLGEGRGEGVNGGRPKNFAEPDISVFNLPFDEAVAYFARKGVVLSPNSWRQLWQDAHARAFTVARVTAADVVTDIQSELQRALAEGRTLNDFINDLEPTLERRGWLTPTGEGALITLPDGTVQKRLTPWRLETIFNTNLSSAYSVGRYEQIMQVADRRPWWQYMTVGDSHVRPEHAALHGLVWRYDHPVWDRIYPPNGFNCRCYIKTLSNGQLDGQSITPETAGAPIQPDEGWDYNVGKAGLAAWQPDLSAYPEEVRNFLANELRKIPSPPGRGSG